MTAQRIETGRQPLLIPRRCPLCGRDNADQPTLDIAPDEWRMKTCPDCDMTYLEVAPDISELFETFAWEKQHHIENARRHAGMGPVALKTRSAWRKFRPLPRKNVAALLEARRRAHAWCSRPCSIPPVAWSPRPCGSARASTGRTATRSCSTRTAI